MSSDRTWRWWLCLIASALVMALVAVEHLSVVSETPLVCFGMGGAEYIEHIERAAVFERTDGYRSLGRLWALASDLKELDGSYPPLLHILAALWSRAFGQGIQAAVNLNLVFLALLALATALLTQRLRDELVDRPPPTDKATEGGRPWPLRCAPLLAAALVIAAPAMAGAARRYYYDLPMTLAVTAAFAAMLVAHRSWRGALLGGLARALALMFKWTAGFYLMPLWGLAVMRGARRGWGGTRRGAAARLACGAALTIALCLPLLGNSRTVMAPLDRVTSLVGVQLEVPLPDRGSFEVSLHQSNQPLVNEFRQDDRLVMTGQRIVWYGDALTHAVAGAALFACLAVFTVVGWRRWRVAVIVTLAALVPLGFLVLQAPVRDERFLLPLLPWIIAAAAVHWGSARRHGLHTTLALTALAAAVVQLLAFDGVIPLRRQLGLRSSTQLRGWNLVGEAATSPFEAYDAHARDLCRNQEHGVALRIDSELIGIRGWQWAVIGHCQRDGRVVAEVDRLLSMPPPAATAASERIWLLSGRPLDEPWLELLERGAIPSRIPVDTWLYRVGARVEPREEPSDSMPVPPSP